MDRRSWPWKKKSSDKAATEKAVAALEAVGASLTLSGPGTRSIQDNYERPKYVQISVETYSHLTGLEDQVKTYEEQVQALESEINKLNEKLSAKQTEITTKENLVKQHAKVAEDAVSGWEKAEAEASALKLNLDSVMKLKLTAEDRASHFDNALKECMRQIQNLKEEHENKLHEIVVSKTNQMEKIKQDFELRIANLDQELLKSSTENSTLLRSLQERSNMVVTMSEEKSQAYLEMEHLRNNLELSEKEIDSLKYELHMASKEQEIRNEEKNMIVRSAEVANKQYLDGLKKIAKLEAEVQKLRVLMRKKLPGPAALAQMKLEVDYLGRDYVESQLRKSPIKTTPSPSMPPQPEFSSDSVEKFKTEIEFLTQRLLAMEEDSKMLKEALANRNSELQSSRSVCAKITSKLQNLEAELQNNDNQLIISKQPSLTTSISEEGNDDAASCSESYSTTLISEVSQNKEKKMETFEKKMEIMDDFLDMEKLASGSNESNVSAPDKQQNISDDDKENLLLTKLHSRMSITFDSLSKESDMGNILDKIKRTLHDAHDTLHQHYEICVFEGFRCSHDADMTREKDIILTQDKKPDKEIVEIMNPELESAICHIHDFLLCLDKESMKVEDPSPGSNGLSEEIEELSYTLNKALCGDISSIDLVLELSRVFSKASVLRLSDPGFKNIAAENINSDCEDKVALLESNVVPMCSHSQNFDLDKDTPTLPCKCVVDDFEQLKSEKNKLEIDLATSTETLEKTKSQLWEAEKLLENLKSELASAHKSNSLAETQVKCMAESYKLLEARAKELETEVHMLRAKTESLGNEIEGEKKNHEDALAKCKDLQDQLQCYVDTADSKTKEERELAAAAEKLAECQETIFLLGKQLNSMRPRSERMGSPYSDRSHRSEGFAEEEELSMTVDFDHRSEMDSADYTKRYKAGSESPIMDVYNSSPYNLSDTVKKVLLRSPIRAKHRPTKSGSSSSSSSSNPTPEKQSRAFSRFFLSKGKI